MPFLCIRLSAVPTRFWLSGILHRGAVELGTCGCSTDSVCSTENLLRTAASLSPGTHSLDGSAAAAKLLLSLLQRTLKALQPTTRCQHTCNYCTYVVLPLPTSSMRHAGAVLIELSATGEAMATIDHCRLPKHPASNIVVTCS